MKQIILDNISDLVTDFLYYNRKSDEDLPVGRIESLVAEGVVTIDEMVDEFRKSLESKLGELS